jgi:hypothetical protein
VSVHIRVLGDWTGKLMKTFAPETKDKVIDQIQVVYDRHDTMTNSR